MNGAVVGQVAVCVAVAVLSGLLYRLGSGLRPVPVAMWVAPLPLLVLASRVPWFAAVGVAASAWLIGQSGLWSYYTRDMSMPTLPVAVQFVGGCAGVGCVVGLARAHLVDGHVAEAALTLPMAWAAMEFLVALTSPHGAWWSVAYTQADVPAVTQVASLTGVWGISALLALPASVAAAVTAPEGTSGERLLVLLVAVAVVAVLAGHAVARDRRVISGELVHVGLAAVEQSGGPVPIHSPEGAVLVSRYVAGVRLLADRGAGVIVLPEVTFAVDESRMAEQMRPLAQAAADLRVDVVVGVARRGETGAANVAVVLGAVGESPGQYEKHHLVPGLEAAYRPGRDLLYLPHDPRVGVLICKDLDFPRLVRAYRRGGARILLAPAWDVGHDGWLHSRMAVVRGVEAGVAVARVARAGRATVSDAFGRVIAETDTSEGGTADARVPLAAAPTLYSRLGDWFGWCCLAATTLIAVT
ncbi:nitrilase-related carbon-nitrogen hydrolase [Streptomyces litchfieldiae]|uniref:Nitrilase-related carbon-nitrogen hydrolase n=1 Tax=Streptomyces litchfieldiae TaxID=3075543 RepID=A0ABU2MYL0_9ACTN|nr:nitrilase-related carbon-nitrogen hydrolase [Streptomyces sp. DSM 44938]MDT0345893.1 nitrilase-related carbon-nitrogen hydrolase [Streptomyces sp. DSM 44938]